MNHIRFTDALDHALHGTPLPCSCDACRAKAERWEADRGLPTAFAEQRPPSFWAAREEIVAALLGRRRTPAVGWAFAAAALVVLACAVFLLIRPSRESRWRRFEMQIPAVQETLNRPVLGDLEACSVVLFESVEASEEESL